MSNPSLPSRGLIIIARNATGQVITRLVCTRSRNVVSAMKSARLVLLLKEGAVRVEVHREESPTSTYVDRPLVTLSREDFPI
jgi:hypothetical protein